MQTQESNSAQSGAPATEPATDHRPFWRSNHWIGRLAIVAGLAVASWTTATVFQGLMVRGGEKDAQLAMTWIAKQIQRETAPGNSDLPGWLAAQPTLLHRLGDARAHGEALHYHGYAIGWDPIEEAAESIARHAHSFQAPVLGTLWAAPLQPGHTGNRLMQLTVNALPHDWEPRAESASLRGPVDALFGR